MILNGYKVIKGEIECITGLHIGGSAETIEIGGMDYPIIKNPLDGYPYIPGSSIKGKMRSLLELKYDMIEDNPGSNKFGDVHTYNGKNCKKEKCFICRIFGTSADEAKFGPSRLIVRDAYLTEDSKKELERMKMEKGLPYSEDKWENVINRITAKATPRQIERVPAGIKFSFELVFRIFNTDTDSQNLLDKVKEGIELIEMDALGGSGSRGYGKVKFKVEGEKAWKL